MQSESTLWMKDHTFRTGSSCILDKVASTRNDMTFWIKQGIKEILSHIAYTSTDQYISLLFEQICSLFSL